MQELSPLSAFLGRWGLPAADEDALIDRIVETATENLAATRPSSGRRVRVLNSRDHPIPSASRTSAG